MANYEAKTVGGYVADAHVELDRDGSRIANWLLSVLSAARGNV